MLAKDRDIHSSGVAIVLRTISRIPIFLEASRQAGTLLFEKRKFTLHRRVLVPGLV